MVTSSRRIAVVPSPIGDLLLVSDGRALVELHMDWSPSAAGGDDLCADDDVLRRARRQLERYFAGRLRDFDLPLAPAGTPFQKRVWKALSNIPYGTTISYGEQARRVGKPSAARAVGHANGRNPIGLIIPCHRVIGADGTLTGYGGGLNRKEWLLRHEARIVGLPPAPGKRKRAVAAAR